MRNGRAPFIRLIRTGWSRAYSFPFGVHVGIEMGSNIKCDMMWHEGHSVVTFFQKIQSHDFLAMEILKFKGFYGERCRARDALEPWQNHYFSTSVPYSTEVTQTLSIKFSRWRITSWKLIRGGFIRNDGNLAPRVTSKIRQLCHVETSVSKYLFYRASLMPHLPHYQRV